MGLLAEELVQEWLNRQGYFTIRGIKLGVDEIDLLAVKLQPNFECRHIEVQVSFRPISYIAKISKENQKKYNLSANSCKKRPLDLLRVCVEEWVNKKFNDPRKHREFRGHDT